MQQDAGRQLRQRNHVISYVEPKLNVKIRQVRTRVYIWKRGGIRFKCVGRFSHQGDYYGLMKRACAAQRPKQRFCAMPSIQQSRVSEYVIAVRSPHNSTPQQSQRITRRLKRISYVEPKLNAKLRQVRLVLRHDAVILTLAAHARWPMLFIGRQVHLHDLSTKTGRRDLLETVQ